MYFNRGYYHPMDRESERVYLDQEKPLYEMSPKDIGISTHPSKDALEQLKSRIFQGASLVEIGFAGKGKGSMSQGATTPEMYDTWERAAMRDLAQVNKVKLSTHASVNAGPLSGLSNDRFDEQARDMALNEIKRAVDFAADTTNGGAIVVHVGEFPRPISETYGKEGFRGYELEPEKAVLYLVDKVTGNIVTGLRKDMKIPWPEYETDSGGNVVYERDNDGNIKKDRYGNPIPVPRYDPKTGEFKARMVGWDFFAKQADEWNTGHPNEKPVDAHKWFYEAYLNAQERQYRGMALYWGRGYDDVRKELEKKRNLKKYYEQMLDKVPPEERWKVEEELKKVEEAVRHYSFEVDHMKETSLSYAQQIKEIQHKKENTVSIEEYGVVKTADTIARAAEYAYVKSRKSNEPLFIAPENVFPEQYGSHPQELKKIILESRRIFIEKMRRKGMSEGQAEQMAKKHIKATFDIGHAFTWKKYFTGDPNRSYEANEKEFKRWLIDQVKDLAKSEVIGHVHVSDNFGYEDEHVTPGRGIAPIKEFLDEIKKAGIKEVIVEPAHQDYRAMLGGWHEFGGEIYGAYAGTRGRQRWSDVEFSYFGRTRTPYYIFGDYAPSQDWTLWTQVPLE